jgi:alpha-beta hydrolase superfamily lysophospholipase
MGHGKSMVTQGYFAGGWFTAVADSYQLLQMTRAELPEVPYVLFGHSMGSFMARTILAQYPDSGIDAAIICGTGWMPTVVLQAGKAMGNMVCKLKGERNPSSLLHGIMFGSYNQKVEHPRTPCDWLSRDEKVVDAYVADPLCGFMESAGLARDMLTGILYIQQADSLAAMRKELPVFFIAGGDDPVGGYGTGVRQAAAAFRNAGMQFVSERIYPLCRHEILNEINKQEVYEDIAQWIGQFTK